MAYWYRPIVNSDLIGEKLTIQLPGFPYGMNRFFWFIPSVRACIPGGI